MAVGWRICAGFVGDWGHFGCRGFFGCCGALSGGDAVGGSGGAFSADGGMLPALLLWLLPALFLLHDAEEALFLPAWLRRNRALLGRRFPHLAHRLLPHLDRLTTGRFAAMASEELLLLLGVTGYAFISHDYTPWLALFLAFGVHLAVHVVQWIAVGRFVPVAATSLLSLVYWGWGIRLLVDSRLFTLQESLLCGAAGCLVAVGNLLLLHTLAGRAGRKEP